MLIASRRMDKQTKSPQIIELSISLNATSAHRYYKSYGIDSLADILGCNEDMLLFYIKKAEIGIFDHINSDRHNVLG